MRASGFRCQQHQLPGRSAWRRRDRARPETALESPVCAGQPVLGTPRRTSPSRRPSGRPRGGRHPRWSQDYRRVRRRRVPAPVRTAVRPGRRKRRAILPRSRGTRMSTSRVALTDPCRFAATPPASRYRTRWRFSRRHTRRTRLSVPGVRLGMAPTLVFVPRLERSHERLERVGCQLDEIAVQALALGQPCGRAGPRCTAARRLATRRAGLRAHRGDYSGVSVNCAGSAHETRGRDPYVPPSGSRR